MVFSSLTFLFFFLPAAVIGNYLLPKPVRNYWLLAASLFFYGWGAHKFLLVMIASIVCNYLLARWISACASPRARKAILILAVVFNLSILFYNKYMNLLTRMLNTYVSGSIPRTGIALPIGISFFTFQTLSYVIDVYRGTVAAQRNVYHLGLYISFFPQLIAGPIVRYADIAAQIEDRTVTLKQFCAGVRRFMMGFSMKILLANSLAVVADQAFGQCHTDAAGLSPAFAWIGAFAYALQIFFDFSGYSSMAIGLGKMFGFEFMENFNLPYMAGTVTDFWRRWHISLSRWFRDYVYIPLGGSRVDKKWKLIRNLFVTWILTGFWHGASFRYILWGGGTFSY